MRIGGIEAGGTKMVCAVGNENGELAERISIPTAQPKETLGRMAEYLKQQQIEALGIGCFGPVDLNRKSPAYGTIRNTPKAGWSGCDIVGFFRRELGVPVGFDTDVNAAVLGEVTWGAARECENALYITIGTGVGVGVYCNGALLHGLVHPEAGHIFLARHPKDSYEGCCPFHRNCMEGLASGPAIEKRWGKPGRELTGRTEVWEMEAFYIAQAAADYILSYSPEKVILWGGVMHQEGLFPLVRAQVKELLGGYVGHPVFETDLSSYIIPPALGENQGVLGAIRLGALARERMEKHHEKG